MTHERPQPRTFRADLAEAFGEATIALGSPPTLAFTRPPYGFTRPLTREELGALAAGRFSADLDAQLRACAPPPIPPLDEADRARIVRLAGEAWIALTVGPPAGRDPEPRAEREPPDNASNQAGFWLAPATRAVAGPELFAPPPSPEPPAHATGEGTDATGPNQAPPGTVVVAAEDSEPVDAEMRIGGATAASAAEVSALPAPPAPRRALKVTLTLTPDGADDYRALVGVGADGCDPFFRALAGPGTLATILAAVPEVVAAAEDRWLGTPRYPTSVATGEAVTAKATTTAKTGVKKSVHPTPAAPPTQDTSVTPAIPAASAAKRQIELFG